ncbi:MAG: glutathione S-transferase family protein [Pseudomonadota bacterium]
MILFYSPNSCALASHIALEQVGVPYEARRVDFSKNEQKQPEYLAINPKGRVPALVTERGVLTETPAILAYLCQAFPAANLAPVNDPFAFAHLQSFNSYLSSTVHVAHAHRYRGYRWADDPAAIEAMKKKVPQTVGECIELIERDMFAGPYVMGDAYTVCDMYLFTICQWLEGDEVDINRFPKLAQHRQRMLADPVVRKVLAMQVA